MMTASTAAHRGNQRRASTDTAGSRPIARNNPRPISSSTARTMRSLLDVAFTLAARH
jgi:hypothetical protein